MAKNEVEDFLAHYGVLGMKWGKSKNPDYTPQQVKRDRQLYGTRGVNRINKNLNAGDQISVARGVEVTRKNAVVKKNKYIRPGGKVLGALGGVVAANVAISSLKKAVNSRAVGVFITKVFGSNPNTHTNVALGLYKASNFLNTPKVRLTISSGAAYVGNLIGGDIAVNANMRSHGYDPNRK